MKKLLFMAICLAMLWGCSADQPEQPPAETTPAVTEPQYLPQEQLVQGVVVARTDYINENPDIITEFMNFNEVSVNYLSANPENASIFLVIAS